MDLINIFTEISTNLSPILAILLVFLFTKIIALEKRADRNDFKTDKTTDILNDLKENVAFIRAKIESLEKIEK